MTDVGDLLAVDPSIRSPGAALFRDGKLVAAARVTFKIDTSRNDGERCMVAADAVVEWSLKLGAKVVTVAHEWPQIYAASKSKGDPNELIHMAGVDLAVDCALMICAAQRGQHIAILTYTPAEWIGQLPKKTRGSAKTSPRAQRIISRLEPDELRVMPDQHDAIDAVGIGLHALGRLGVRRVFATR